MMQRFRKLGGLRLDYRFVYQHDGNVVFDAVDAVALAAFQAFGVLAMVEGLLAFRTDQHLEEVGGEHGEIVRHVEALAQCKILEPGL
jgi:hypothetical protein